ncbi:uncharacterized protein LOC102807007, partial [Saccoglossus kowalevskii]|uniref:Protein ycf2-like n=1 Tax=Saccoglossus kowalevskii TaxID=10224 RepID=A0ABM0LY43_SACKO
NKHKVTEGTSDDSLHLPKPPSNIPGNADQERVESEDGENIKQDSELKEDEEVKMETGVEKEEGENDENIEERVGEDDPGGLEQEQEQKENIKTEVDEDEQCTKSDEAAEMKSLENKQSEIPEFPVEGISEGQEPSVHGGSEDQGSPVEGANEGEEFSGGGQGEIPELRQAEDELEHAEHDINDVKSTRDDETILEALNASQISSDFQSWDRVNERGETNSMIPDQPTAPPISMPATLTAVHQNTTAVETSPIKTFPEVGNETSRDIRERLYPEISSLAEDLDKLKPFTADELRLYYYNPQLQTLEDEVDRFIQDSYQERHEFYELIFHYYRSRHNLTAIEKDNKTLQIEYKRQQDNLWIITNHVITAQ